MKYSFVLIAYNEEHNIIPCIESILRQGQLGSDYEIIVVDDGSRDKTTDLVRTFARQNPKVKLVGDGNNHGRGYGRFIGVTCATGEYVIMVDADILLPSTWLEACLGHIGTYDVVGGIAVPDGDVAYIYRRFHLKPKTVMGSTTITGNNGMYRRGVLAKVNFDKNLREGEDVDFNHRMRAAGFTAFCIPGLTVEHQEAKSFPRSMLWLYQSGIGATRQLVRFREVRLPDLAFAATVGTAIAAALFLAVTGNGLGFIVPLAGIFGASLMHARGKFHIGLRRPLSSCGALLVDMVLILCYYAGRCAGPFVLLLNRSAHKA